MREGRLEHCILIRLCRLVAQYVKKGDHRVVIFASSDGPNISVSERQTLGKVGRKRGLAYLGTGKHDFAQIDAVDGKTETGELLRMRARTAPKFKNAGRLRK